MGQTDDPRPQRNVFNDGSGKPSRNIFFKTGSARVESRKLWEVEVRRQDCSKSPPATQSKYHFIIFLFCLIHFASMAPAEVEPSEGDALGWK